MSSTLESDASDGGDGLGGTGVISLFCWGIGSWARPGEMGEIGTVGRRPGRSRSVIFSAAWSEQASSAIVEGSEKVWITRSHLRWGRSIIFITSSPENPTKKNYSKN